MGQADDYVSNYDVTSSPLSCKSTDGKYTEYYTFELKFSLL